MVKSRRQYGTGSITERSPGVWRLRAYVGKDLATGKPRQITKTVHGGKRDAQRALAEMVAKAGDDQAVGSTATVGRLLDVWLDEQAKDPGVRTSTVQHNRSVVNRAIRGPLGAVKLRNLTTQMVDAWYSDLLTRYAVGTAKGTRAVLRAALNRAVEWGWLARNPVGRLKPTTPGAPRQALTVAQVQAVLRRAEADNPDLAAALYLAAVTGLRRGEVAGLRWSDLDWPAQRIAVQRQIAPAPGGQAVGPTKTGQVRTIYAPQAFAMLERHYAAQMSRWGEVEPDGYVFGPLGGGEEPNVRAVSSLWRKHSRAAGVNARLHDLRHFAVTRTVSDGADIASAAAYFGHTAQVMLGTYAHHDADAEARLTQSLALDDQSPPAE